MAYQSEIPGEGNPSFRVKIPGANLVLILGIISVGTCWCWGIPGLIASIFALRIATKGNRLYQENPARYSIASRQNLEAGKLCAFIGLILSCLYLVIVLIFRHFIHAHFPGFHA